MKATLLRIAQFPMSGSSAASKRSRDWQASSESDECDELQEQTAPHPWGVRPWGNLLSLAAGEEDQEAQEDPRQHMGLFRALEDATLLSVLSFLDAQGLVRLGATCRALAVFCGHEPMWKDLLLHERGGAWRWAGSFRATLLNRPVRPLRVAGLFSDLLSKSWLCATARFNGAWLGADTVPRERAAELSPEDFVRRYEAPNRPVLLGGACAGWPLARGLEAWLEARRDTQFKGKCFGGFCRGVD